MSNGEAEEEMTETKEKSESEIEKEKAEAELDAIKAQKDLISEILPKGEAKPLEGTVETDKVGYVAEQVAYSATKNLAHRIAEELKEDNGIPDGASILIVSHLDYVSGDLPLVEVNSQIESFSAMLQKQQEIIKKQSPERLETAAAIPLALSAIPGTISFLADIAAYFRTDYTIEGVDFTLKQESLTAAVAGQLATNNRKVFIENFYMMGKSSETLENFNNLGEKVIELKEANDRLLTVTTDRLKKEIAQIQDEMRKLKDGKAKHDPKTQQDSITDLDDKIAAEQKKLEDGQSRIDRLNAIVQDTKAILREQIKELQITHLLYLGILASGGQAIVRRNLFRVPQMSFAGGTSGCYILAKTDGEIITASTLSELSCLEYKLSNLYTEGIRSIRIEEKAK
jgi:hypothetical protein